MNVSMLACALQDTLKISIPSLNSRFPLFFIDQDSSNFDAAFALEILETDFFSALGQEIPTP